MEFNLENPLTIFQDLNSDTLGPSLFSIETYHMPSQSYIQNLKTKEFDISIRSEATSIISQLSYPFDPFLSYLAGNYLDRFFSSQGMPQTGKPWVLKLLAISCVSLAAKMMKSEFSVSNYFQYDEAGLMFDTKTIERMELLILGALQWRMRSITPFSFFSYFLYLFKDDEDPVMRQCLKSRATEIIFTAQNEIKLLEFNPSVVAAAALLSACHELFPLQYSCFHKVIANCSYVDKENLTTCYSFMQEIIIYGYGSILSANSSLNTPVNVLHWQESENTKSTNTQEISTTTGTAIIRPERGNKRRRLGELCKDNTFQLSQIPAVLMRKTLK